MRHEKDRVLLEIEYKTYYEYPAPAGRTYVNALQDVIASGKQVGIESSRASTSRAQAASGIPTRF